MAWNGPAVRVAELDFATATPTQRDRNMMRLAADPHFRRRAVNWEEIAAYLIGIIKLALPDTTQPGDNPYFWEVVQDIAIRFPEALNDLVRLWSTVPPLPPGQRNIYYPVWRTSDGARLRFNSVVSSWNDFDAFFANDWHPADADTWEWLTSAPAPVPSMPALEPDRRSWFELLRRAREQSGLSRAELAALAGVAMRSLDNYETGARRPSRETLVRQPAGAGTAACMRRRTQAEPRDAGAPGAGDEAGRRHDQHHPQRRGLRA